MVTASVCGHLLARNEGISFHDDSIGRDSVDLKELASSFKKPMAANEVKP